MKKLVIKTVAITLAILVGAFVVAFGATCFIAPKFLAGVFDGVGGYSTSVFFYESNFKKTGELEDLALLIDKIDEDVDSDKLQSYLKIMTESDGFDDYCVEQDESGAGIVTTKEYYTGLYATVLVKNGKVSDAISVASSFVEKEGYTKSNPYRIVIAEFKDDENILTEWKVALNEETLTLTGDGLDYALGDIEDINNLLEK